ncbi:MAG: hypothetical protein Ct9H300mP16_07820 [Pseudomonadota bacterium]|nr:MAG: hypothetical protein Ct9H300mP16_07820 [Pseudomonadota bacterium]
MDWFWAETGQRATAPYQVVHGRAPVTGDKAGGIQACGRSRMPCNMAIDQGLGTGQ